MSQNLNLSFEIHDFDEEKADLLNENARAFLQKEGFTDDDLCIGMGEEVFLAYSTYPQIISGAHRWLPDVEKRWIEMAHETNGAPCRAFLESSSADGEEV